MRVRLRFFAVLREQMGASSARAVPAGTTVGALWRSVVAERPELDAIPVRFAVNQTYVEASHRLAEDDENEQRVDDVIGSSHGSMIGCAAGFVVGAEVELRVD